MHRSSFLTLAAILGSAVLEPALAQAADPPATPGATPKDTPAASDASAPAQPPPQNDAPDAPDLGTTTLPPLPAPPHTLRQWNEVVALLDSRSVELILSKQRVIRAEGQARQALAGALPTISGRGSVGYSFSSQGAVGNDPGSGAITRAGSSISAQLSLSQPILAPRAWYGIHTADLGVESAKLSLEDQRRAALLSIAGAVVAVISAERVAEINRVGHKTALSRLALTRRRLLLGSATRLDVLRLEQDAQAAKASAISGDESLLRARESLGLTFNSDEAYGVAQGFSLNEMEGTLKSACAKGPLDQRPDVRAAQIDLELARRGIMDNKLAFAPTAVLSSSAGINNTPIASPSTFSWSIQAVLTLPLWDGGARYGAMRIAQAAEEEQKQKLSQVLQGAKVEFTQAKRAVLVAEEAQKVAEEQRNLAREAEALSQKAFESGAGTSFDLVDAAQKVRAAEIDLARKELDLVRARMSALLSGSARCAQ